MKTKKFHNVHTPPVWTCRRTRKVQRNCIHLIKVKPSLHWSLIISYISENFCLCDVTGAGENFSSVFSCGSHSLCFLLPESKILLAALSYTTQSCLCIVYCLHTCLYLCVCVCEVVPGGTLCASLARCHRGRMCTHSLSFFFSPLLLTQLVFGQAPVKMDHGWSRKNTIHGSRSWPACSEGRTGKNLPEMDATKCIHRKLKHKSGDLILNPELKGLNFIKHYDWIKAIFTLHFLWRSALHSGLKKRESRKDVSRPFSHCQS